MEREQEEMQFLGVFSIYKESYNIIVAWKKIFSQITLTLILPLSFIFLIHLKLSNVLFKKIMMNTQEIIETPQGTPQYHKLSSMISSEWALFFLFKLIYFTFLLIFSLLSTSAVVYTIASIYTSREVTFTKIMSVVPRVWKRLMVTFLCTFLAFFVYNVVSFIFLIIWLLTSFGIKNGGVPILVIIGVLYFVGLMYLTVQFLKLSVLFFAIQFLFTKVVVQGWKVDSVEKTVYGILCFLLLSHLFLFGLVIQTVLYFVCKSYHHQNIDKSALSDHLEVYQKGEYEPLKAKDLQLEQYHDV